MGWQRVKWGGGRALFTFHFRVVELTPSCCSCPAPHFTQRWRFVSSCGAVPAVTGRFSWSGFFSPPAVNIAERRNPLHRSLYPLTFSTVYSVHTGCLRCTPVWVLMLVICCSLFFSMCIWILVGTSMKWLSDWGSGSYEARWIWMWDFFVLAWKLQALLLPLMMVMMVMLSSVLLAPSVALLSLYPQLRESSLYPASVLWWETPVN